MKKNFEPSEPTSLTCGELELTFRRFRNLKFQEKIWLIENLAKTEDLLIEKVLYDFGKIYYGVNKDD